MNIKRNAYMREYYKKNKKRCTEYNTNWRKNNPEKYNKMIRAQGVRLRKEALTVYGNKCICCGETEPHFLAFDHINGGGSKQKVRKRGSIQYLRFLIKEKPKDIQILCHNCNCAKGFYGICPHKEEYNGLQITDQ